MVYDPSPVQGYLDKLTTELSSGTAPDISWIPGASLADYGSKGVLMDMMPLASKDSTFKLTDLLRCAHEGAGEGGAASCGACHRDISTMVHVLQQGPVQGSTASPTRRSKRPRASGPGITSSRHAEAMTDPAKGTYGFSFSNWWGLWGWFVNAAGGSLFNADRTACGLDYP